MTGIGFNNIPGAGLTAPIMAFEFNSGGQYTSTTRLILFGHKVAAGSLALNTSTVVASQAQADALAGPGSMLREAFRAALANAPAQPIYLMAVAEIGVAPVWSITIGALPAGGGIATIQIQGETISVPVSSVDTPTTVAAALAAAITSYYNPLTNAMLQVTATSALGVVTVTSRHAGAIMNDVDFYVPTNIAGNVLASTGVYTLAVVTAGTGVPTLAAPLAALGDDPADFVVSPWSDSVSLGYYASTTNDISGRWAWLRQSYGQIYAPTTGSFSAATTLGLTLNDRHFSALRRIAGTPTPSWVWAAGMVARVAPWLSDCVTGNVSRNQTGLIVIGLAPPRDRSTLDGYSARNTLNNSGISTFSVDAAGNVCVDKIVTTYRLGPSGQPDTVFRDIQAMYQVSGGIKYMRSVLATEHGQKALADENPGGLAAISTPAEVKGTLIHAYDDLVFQGVFQDTDTFSRLLIVQINAQNPNRVDVYCPIDRVNPLDILAVNATIYQQFPVAA